jgi:hypothetical protein
MLMLDEALTRLAPRRVFLLVALVGVILGGSLTSVTSAQASSPPTELQTEAAEPTPGGFKLNGKLNPDGLPTTYYFNYNTGAECEEIEGCARETAVVGPLSGDTQQEVPPIELTGLAPGQTYRYWLVAKNADATVRGAELTFATPTELPPSEVVTQPAEQTASGFRLKGDLNPGGLPTTYYFMYNTGFECEEIEGCARETAVVGPLSGDTQQEVPPIEVTGLAPAQTYRYRLIAKNADGIVRGGLLTFATPPENHNGSGGQSPTQEPKSEPPLPLLTPLVAGRPPSGLPLETIRTRPLTNSQKLARALRVCAKKPKSKRTACEKQARVKYGVAIKNTGKRASRGKK